MKPAPVILWAVIVRSKRSEWIHHGTLRQTRKDAWQAFCESWGNRPALEWERKAGRYRLARVVVTERG